MLKQTPNAELRASDWSANAAALPSIKPEDVIRTFRRQWPVVAACVLLALFAAALFLLTASPKYTSTASILIDTRKTQLFQNQQVVGDIAVDASGVESQAEILRSDSIALAVIRKLKLTDDPEFADTRRGFLRSLFGQFLGADEPASTELIERKALSQFNRGLQIKRIGLTYAIEVAFTSLDGAKSATIVNTIAETYMTSELDSRYASTLRASRWLQERMAELREQARVADAAVQAFKADNNIVDTGRGLMSDQQLADVNTQYVTARAATAEAKARLDRIQSIANDNFSDATVTDALRNDVITRLRAQLLDITAREADWSARYGRNHVAAANLRNQMREIRRAISDELSRIAETYKSDYEIALAREQAMRESLGALVDQSALTGQAQIKLRDLESTAQSFRNLYDSFLQRFMEATQQQTFPISEARVISPAIEPLRKSSPKTTLVLAIALVGGLAMGVAGAFIREQMDNVFRETGDVERLTGDECLGILPEVPPNFAGEDRAADTARRILRTNLGVARHIQDAPFSRFSETVRSVKVAADLAGLSRTMQVIGCVSALPQEGKTTVILNLGQLVAANQQRAIVIDGDLRNPALTRAVAPEATAGLVEVLTGRANEADVIWTDPITGLHVLPAVIEGRISHTSELISSPEMARLLGRLRERYDYVFVDLPPILPVVDVRAASNLIDGFVLVIRWGHTQKSVVMDALSTAELVSERMIGSVLNRANPSLLKRLESSSGLYYGDYHHGYGYRSAD
jgi:succinoglycan biosynthesis transport protein ExoP